MSDQPDQPKEPQLPDPPAAPIDDDTELMTPAEVQRELRISPSTLRRWANDGDIEVVRLPSGHRRYPAAVVTAIRRRIPDPAAT